ncbi:hypothetical protein BT96DRAFT_1005033 [Gymnopus androsaceus JB14]|uniref:F-box domain-containing protein n=1 Tax=Gymnopus androsaceus JB14 TaxID=1447944 RepID=A0A6A4GQD7_9AGAR|nr:hypothetical protein BT96DRAFT_1005033 [Gymnopus androsaceus JB14]
MSLFYHDLLHRRNTPEQREIYMLLDAPKLRHVYIMSNESSIANLFLLPAEQLYSLITSNPAAYEDLLPRCKELVRLGIGWPSFYGRFPTNHFFLLSALKSLAVSFCKVRRVCHAFADLAGFQHRSVTALSSSSLTLENFRVNDGQLFAKELTAALALFPEIKFFHIDSFPLNVDPLLQALTYTKDHHKLLPNLTTLALHH